MSLVTEVDAVVRERDQLKVECAQLRDAVEAWEERARYAERTVEIWRCRDIIARRGQYPPKLGKWRASFDYGEHNIPPLELTDDGLAQYVWGAVDHWFKKPEPFALRIELPAELPTGES